MTTKRLCIFLFTMLFLISGASAETFNVKKYGARGNGKKLDSFGKGCFDFGYYGL